ncbi:unnamed protein product, partial [marine sediment metagenome]
MTIKKNKKDFLLEEKIVLNLLKEKVKDKSGSDRIKRQVCKEFGASFPSNIELLKTYHRLVNKKRIKPSKTIERLLITRPVRSLSGIVNVSVLTKPYPCPGKCIYCPTQRGFPKSYLAGEPAADRAKFLKFNPYTQVQKRLEALKMQGHPTNKIEL